MNYDEKKVLIITGHVNRKWRNFVLQIVGDTYYIVVCAFVINVKDV